MNEATRQSMGSSRSEHWGTPKDFLERVNRVGPIILDPAGNMMRSTGAQHTVVPPDGDGLSASWHELARGGLVFCNPPYGKATLRWVQKAVIESARGAEIILLTAARTETKWFHDWVLPTAKKVCLVKGRLKFHDLTQPGAPQGDPAFFPSAVSYWGPKEVLFKQVFSEIGYVIDLD